MKTRSGLWIVAVVLCLAAALSGCEPTGSATKTTKPLVIHVPPVLKDYTGAGEGNVPYVVDPKLKGGLSPAAKRKRILETRLSLQRAIICTEEQLKLSGGAEATTAAKEELTTKLAEIGLKIIQTTEALSFNPTEAKQDAFRKANDCNMVFLAEGSASKVDKLGNFYSFKSDLKGKLLNLTTHQIIASKTVGVRGKRVLNENQAAESAQTAAAAQLATYLTDEAVRWWERLSLLRKTLVVDGVDSARWANFVHQELQRRVGVYYVSLESWDPKAEQATYEVLYRFDVERFVPTYIEAVPGKNLKVKVLGSKSETIKACEEKGGILHWLGL